MKENILQKIVRTKQGELEKLRKRYGDISKKPDQKKRSGFKKNFTGIKRVKIIAEIKPASPSEGVIFDPTEKKIKEIASLYAKYPIGAVSVLTDQEFFHGAYENIGYVKEVTDVPVLCKDFIVDAYQVALAKHFGADAILLIAESLPMVVLMGLYRYAKQVDLGVLFEVHSKGNLELLLKQDVDIIGINNRDLETMKVDISKCLDMKASIPADKTVIAESGFYIKEEIKRLEEKGFNGVLIGTSLLKESNTEDKLKELVYYYE